MNYKEVRINKIKNWQTIQNAYPDMFERSHNSKEYKLLSEEQSVSIAGRVMNIRDIGKIAFIQIQDFAGKAQIVLNKNNLNDLYKFYLDNLDIGDHIGVSGSVYTTKTKEISILVEKITLLSKALLPLPEKWHGIADEELKLRKRYVDLIMSQETRDRFLKRNMIIQSIKQTLNDEGFIEVETPILQNTASGAMANPFKTHHSALNIPLYLRIAPETYLKRLIAGGYEKIYEIGKSFRNEGIDSSHLQEFTMLEYYAAYWNYNHSIKFIQKIFKNMFDALKIQDNIVYEDKKINITLPWPVMTYRDLIYKYTNLDLDILLKDEDLLIKEVSKFIDVKQYKSPATMIDGLYKKHCRPLLIDPIIIINQPAVLGPLARKSDQNNLYSDRFQIVMNGLEIVNSYSELVDPIAQREVLIKQQEFKQNGEEEFMEMEEDFLEAMEHAIPPTSGLGIGIDRIVALFTNASTLKDVVFFPNLKKINE